MPQLENNKHELFAQYRLIHNKKDSYIKAGYDCKQKYAAQNAYTLSKNQDIIDRIEELKAIARDDAMKEVNEYIKFFDDIAFARGDFSGANRGKLEQRMTAASKAMKAQGIEGDTKLNLGVDVGAFQLVMHTAPKEEEEKNGSTKD